MKINDLKQNEEKIRKAQSKCNQAVDWQHSSEMHAARYRAKEIKAINYLSFFLSFIHSIILIIIIIIITKTTTYGTFFSSLFASKC
jgi:hypothetical protein